MAEENTWTEPDDTHAAEDPRYGIVKVKAWHELHPKLEARGHWEKGKRPPIAGGSLLRIQVDHLPKRTTAASGALWLWWSGEGKPDLELCWRAYLHRFDIEHGFRFVKRTLGWITPEFATPDQADRWTWLIIAAFTQLHLARGLVADHRQPWEKPRPPEKLAPGRVRRGFRALRCTLGSPTQGTKFTRPGPGRPKGTTRPPRTRYPVEKKVGAKPRKSPTKV